MREHKIVFLIVFTIFVTAISIVLVYKFSWLIKNLCYKIMIMSRFTKNCNIIYYDSSNKRKFLDSQKTI